MSIKIHTLVLGPIQTNTYVVVDESTRKSVIIDLAVPSKQITSLLEEHELELAAIWITHAHFDHIGGVKWLRSQIKHPLPVALHDLDTELWLNGGGSKDFGFDFDPGPAPNLPIVDGQILKVGQTEFKVLHTPGHCQGHVTYVSLLEKVAFCGDLIFRQGIGRSDLQYSQEADLFESIRQKIFTLPQETVLYPGHGQITTVKEEMENNPFL